MIHALDPRQNVKQSEDDVANKDNSFLDTRVTRSVSFNTVLPCTRPTRHHRTRTLKCRSDSSKQLRKTPKFITSSYPLSEESLRGVCLPNCSSVTSREEFMWIERYIRRIQVNRKRALEATLNEQERQRKSGLKDLDLLAEVYRGYSLLSMADACTRAKHFERETQRDDDVNEYSSHDSGVQRDHSNQSKQSENFSIDSKKILEPLRRKHDGRRFWQLFRGSERFAE